jgi:hypothetical protein
MRSSTLKACPRAWSSIRRVCRIATAPVWFSPNSGSVFYGLNSYGPIPATMPTKSSKLFPSRKAPRLEIVKRSDDLKGFVVVPRRWVVERTFSWFGRNRRLAKDYKNLADTVAAFVTLAAIQFGLSRLARSQSEFLRVGRRWAGGRWASRQAFPSAALSLGAASRRPVPKLDDQLEPLQRHDPTKVVSLR